MLGSEIDDIFAKKPIVKSSDKPVQPPPQEILKKKKKKKSNKVDDVSQVQDAQTSKEKSKQDAEPQKEDVKGKKRKRAAPEEIIDPSAPIKRRKTEEASAKTSSKKAAKGEIQKFKDSRGSSGKKRTEEGFLVYTEEELGLTKEGGDTALCPFDCECCY